MFVRKFQKNEKLRQSRDLGPLIVFCILGHKSKPTALLRGFPLTLHSLTPLTPFLNEKKKKSHRYKLRHQNQSAEILKYSYCTIYLNYGQAKLQENHHQTL